MLTSSAIELHKLLARATIPVSPMSKATCWKVFPLSEVAMPVVTASMITFIRKRESNGSVL